jgi:hypothetical protein
MQLELPWYSNKECESWLVKPKERGL